jgi:hypothetical protein
MRLIDADELLNRTANLEAVALEQVAKYEPSENPREWHRWTGILQERTAFKYDLMDAPTIETEPIRHGHWEYVKKRLVRGGYVDVNKCSICHKIIMPHLKPNYCPYCAAKMDEEAAQ